MDSPYEDNAITSDHDWEVDLLRRYPEADETDEREGFRDYEDAQAGVKEFYRLNHLNQTVDLNRRKRAQWLPLRKTKMGIWEALEFLNTLIDESDPDIDLPQIEHCLQTSEAIRKDGHPDWFILTGLVHDLGKILTLWGEPQWAVTGDTYPVGCRWSGKIVYPEFFADNPDSGVAEYQTDCGIYERGCGLDQIMISWGHDEYMYHVVKDYLPEPAQYMIRYHSFYPGHREGEYQQLMNDHDREMFHWVHAFNPYDLYSKCDERMDVGALRPFYEELIARYFPAQIDW